MNTKRAKLPFVNFLVVREYLGRDGVWNPRVGGPPLKGGLQINVFGAREHYLRLAEFFRDFALRDTSSNSDYHEHFDGLMSADGSVRLEVILRKDDLGDAIFKEYFPRRKRKKPRTLKTK